MLGLGANFVRMLNKMTEAAAATPHEPASSLMDKPLKICFVGPAELQLLVVA